MAKDVGKISDMLHGARDQAAKNAAPDDGFSDRERAILGGSLEVFKNMRKTRPATEEQMQMAQYRDICYYEKEGDSSKSATKDRDRGEVLASRYVKKVDEHREAASRHKWRMSFDKHGDLLVTGTLFKCNEPDAHGNIIPRPLATNLVERFQRKIDRCRGVMGFLGNRTNKISLVSHTFKSIELRPDGRCVGTIKVLDTEQGRALEHFFKTKSPLVFAPIGAGSVKNVGNNQRVLLGDFTFETFNLTLEDEPTRSFDQIVSEAEMQSEPEYNCKECKDTGIIKLLTSEEECECGGPIVEEQESPLDLGEMYEMSRAALQREVPLLEWRRESEKANAPIVGCFYAEEACIFKIVSKVFKSHPESGTPGFEFEFMPNESVWHFMGVKRWNRRSWSPEEVAEKGAELVDAGLEMLRKRRDLMNRYTDALDIFDGV